MFVIKPTIDKNKHRIFYLNEGDLLDKVKVLL